MNLIGKMLGGILERIPLEKALLLGMRMGLLKKPLELLVKGWKASRGARTQVLLGAAALLGAAGSMGYIPWDIPVGGSVIRLADIIMALTGMGSATALDKVERLLPLVQKVSADVAAEADKPVDQPPAA